MEGVVYMSRKIFKKGDLLIAAAAVAVAAVGIVAVKHFTPAGKTVTVKQNGEVLYKGSLAIPKTVTLENNTVTIENGEVYMSEADCKNLICAHTGKISRNGENIICLPNKVVIEIS